MCLCNKLCNINVHMLNQQASTPDAEAAGVFVNGVKADLRAIHKALVNKGKQLDKEEPIKLSSVLHERAVCLLVEERPGMLVTGGGSAYLVWELI